jgi:endonuclease/exonuclease/phosphatase family metal-dependent hydrolase
VLLVAAIATGCRGSHVENEARPRALTSAVSRAAAPAPATPSSSPPPRAEPAESAVVATDTSPWASPDACRARVGAPLEREAGRVRLGTWNLHWFPDGRPGRAPEGPGVDTEWLACVIAWMNVDVLAVQEVKHNERSKLAVAALTRALDRFTRGAWALQLDTCPNPHGQHVGLLFNKRRAAAGEFATFQALNPHGVPCKDQLRPGLGGYFRFPGGLDLHVISVHLKSGPAARDLGLRRKSFASFFTAFEQAFAATGDADVVFAGDFNTMGCSRCKPSLLPEEELEGLVKILEALPRAYKLVAGASGCSYYYRGRPQALDHFAAPSDMRELTDAARVEGLCRKLRCEPIEPRSVAFPARALSDHCPVLLDIVDADRD